MSKLFNIYGYQGGNFAGNVYDIEGISPTIQTMATGGNLQPLIAMTEIQIVASRGRGDDNAQQFELGSSTFTNTLTSVQKDNYLIETTMDNEKNKIELPPELQGKKVRIRKLTERECFRLMGVDDADIDKIQASGLSKSAQYKLAGNSIVVDVLYHIFRKMFIETEQENSQLTLF